MLFRSNPLLPQGGQQGETTAGQLSAPFGTAPVEVLARHRQLPEGPFGGIVVHRHLRMIDKDRQPWPMPSQALQNLLLLRAGVSPHF